MTIQSLPIAMYRISSGNHSTIGCFVVFNEFFFTVEDTEKILPAGTYLCELTKSGTNKSAGLDICYAINEDIPDRDLFRFMHVGNSHRDCDGCICGGMQADFKNSVIMNSIPAIKKFYKLVDEHHGLNPLVLTIHNV